MDTNIEREPSQHSLQDLLTATPILDFANPQLSELVSKRGWQNLDEYHKIGEIYQFVKNEIRFGYNATDNIPASQVLKDGYGQCNTKGTLLMALVRAVGVPCRFHGFTIVQDLQKGAIPSLFIKLAPKYIIHSWVEVYYENRWVNLEGFILDARYLEAIQRKFSNTTGNFCGYGVATDCLANPPVEWEGRDTYIQREGIHDDFGVFDSPDAFYQVYGTNLTGPKKFMYKYILRHIINYNVSKIRNRKN